MLVYFFTGVWMISLLIFLIYTLISIFFGHSRIPRTTSPLLETR